MIDIVRHGLSVEEIQARLASGWVVIPNVSIAEAAIAVPGAPIEPGGKADIWILPQSLMPQVAVAAALIQAQDTGGDKDTLDWISKRLFGSSLDELRAFLENKGEKLVA